ncbi:helix-turn-helix transcriptional regulator [Pontibacter roseus]|uniref:helix-turn-helix transcriptional regulator n=1 Tax=Pontibacter roseus TaxID=336989 RepID=UPI00035FC108|nr:AraC family transcriptional regulator [Pontibacter roseus]
MFLKEFPDYAWLKRQAETAFENRLVVKGAPLKKDGWPLVILNTHTRHCHRQNIKGPFTIFTNISGTSTVSTGRQRVQVDEDSFFITNRAQYYSLEVDSEQDVETFNMHLGRDVWEDFVYSQSLEQTTLLDNPFESSTSAVSEFPNLLQLQTSQMSKAIQHLHQLSKQPHSGSLEIEEALLPLLLGLAFQKKELTRQVLRIPTLRPATRQELFRRVCMATDYMLSKSTETAPLERLAAMACLSKFHFLRTFTSIHRTTPHQFMLQQRLRRAQRLLSKTRLAVGDIALLCGFPEVSTFSRAFRKAMGTTPHQYRLQVN